LAEWSGRSIGGMRNVLRLTRYRRRPHRPRGRVVERSDRRQQRCQRL